MSNKTYDAAIIGGGIIGLTTALLLKIRHPNLTIAILEQTALAAGASFYSAGLSVPISKGKITEELIASSTKIIEEISYFLNLRLTFVPCIHIINQGNIENFRKKYFGSDLQEIPITQIQDLSLGNIKVPKNKKCFITYNDAHYVSVTELINTISCFLSNKGGAIYEGCQVDEIIEENEYSKIKCANDSNINANKLFIATGPWANYSVKTNSVKPISQPSSLVKKIVAFHLNKYPTSHDPILMMYDEESFLLPLHRHWLFSITSEEWGVNPKQQLRISNEDCNIANKILDKYGFKFDALVAGGRVFCDSYSVTKEISIQKISPNIVKISGASGSGYRLAYGIAEKAINLIL